MIFYFTATGNSLYIAKQLGENPISIAQEMKKEELSYKDDTIGIVVPDYAGEIPHIVRRFLQKAKFETNYLYMIITYGKNQSVVAEWSYYFGKTIGVPFDYIHSIKMVDNYLPHFDMEEEKAIDKQIPEQLSSIRKDLAERRYDIERPLDQAARDAYERVSRLPKEANNGSGIQMNRETKLLRLIQGFYMHTPRKCLI